MARRPSPRPSLLLCAALIAACGGGGSVGKTPLTPPGEVGDKPDGGWFLSDPNQQGNAQEPRVWRLAYGRLAQVFGLDAFGTRVPMATDFLIAPGLVGDGQTYVLETNPITAQELLIVLRDVTDEAPGGGREQFFDALLAAEQNLAPIQEADIGYGGIFSMLPRNGAVVIQLDDLIDPKTLSPSTVRSVTGVPPVLPFEGRLFVDAHHGDLAEHDGQEGPEFYSTRVIFDPTVTEIESFTVDPPLPVNGVGLPPSNTVELATFALRIPTKVSVANGQLEVLRNPSGHPLTTKNNGPVDYGSPTLDVVRAARTGGSKDVTGDPHNGFLPDDDPPRVVGTQLIEIEEPPQVVGPGEFVLPRLVFASTSCAQTPIPGDVLTQTGVFAEVLSHPTPVENGVVKNLHVRLLLFPNQWAGGEQWTSAGIGTGLFLSAYDPEVDAGKSGCFVDVFPDPVGYPENPTVGISPFSSFGLRFSEPMDPLSLTAFDSLILTRQEPPGEDDPPLSTSDYVIGSVSQSLDLSEFTFFPDLPLAHQLGEQEPYWLTLSTEVFEPTDLAGLAVADPPQPTMFTLDPVAAPQINGGRVTRFQSQDEEAPIGGPEVGPIPEWNGQHLYDLQRQTIRPRPVVRYLGMADRTQPVPSEMVPFPAGVQTPLSGLGSKLHAMWRYVDFGLSLTDMSNHNIDIEGMYWSPAEGAVIADQYLEFKIRLCHSLKAPDEYISPASNLPLFPSSGLNSTFDKNCADSKKDKPYPIAKKEDGYSFTPGDLFVAHTGTKLIPWPVNRDAAPEDWRTYTWRNTDVRVRGGEKSGGAPLWVEYFATGTIKPSNQYYDAGKMRTIALPLLMEFNCYPYDGAIGQNPFDISIATNTSIGPLMRAFSTGGVNTTGKVVRINPDSNKTAKGGFNPNSDPPGKSTPERDNTFYIGGADFVTRVSRTHSIWFSADDPLLGGQFAAPKYRDPILEPGAADQPPGTTVAIAFRGMIEFSPPPDACDGSDNFEALENAQTLDSYGDHYDDKCIDPGAQPNHNPEFENVGISFFEDDDEWRHDITEIDGAPYYQVRITFESDIFSGLVPEVSAVAIGWTD